MVAGMKLEYWLMDSKTNPRKKSSSAMPARQADRTISAFAAYDALVPKSWRARTRASLALRLKYMPGTALTARLASISGAEYTKA